MFIFWSHCMAYGILLPQPGIKSMLPALETRVLTTGPPEKSLGGLFKNSWLGSTLRVSDSADLA